MTAPILEVRDVCVDFGRRGSPHRAVDQVSLALQAGQVTALVGESGSGKSTVARAIVGLQPYSEGEVLVEDTLLPAKRRKKELGKMVQIVFQDPFSTLDPSLPVWRSVVEPLELHSKLSKAELRAAAKDLLGQVGLDPESLDRRPAEFSGGQRQRLAIARAISCEPRILICDEAVSALDVTTQAQIVRLLDDLRKERDLAILFISHDLNTVREFAHEVVVLCQGKVMERGTPTKIFEEPEDPYTRRLIDAIPSGDPTRSRRVRARDRVAAATP